ncbi:SGNH/GDSL hydrolase family protein [Rudaeicoccus suwonensis]|uniref:Lysophospholipase L1-like esterase n=1 Tax=Rudaeicoccus suwonensis TaxID=657409 RepID=A0A561E785_9MICO|nr:SGNH/GDSL hydrolase family protein [Rudaeicoccus suwonensis]TWE11462.1 lysophospholipase L1-like esterase [Rudaeicoccus suwonensis]
MGGRFVAIGDSFTEGVGDPNLLYPNGVRGWADRVARQLGRADSDWEYANLAIRSKLLDEVAAEQIDAAIALAPTHVSFYAGGNDIIALRVDMAAVMRRYELALRRLASSGAQLVLFTAFDPTAAPVWEPVRRRLAFFNGCVRDLARDTGAVLIDHALYEDFRDRRMWSADRIHMSKAGHKRMAAHVLQQLGIPHSLKVVELPPYHPRPWRRALREETLWLRDEVVPLLRRRISGVREGDSLAPKWPQPVHPADGMKRLAREQSGDAMRVHADAESARSAT